MPLDERCRFCLIKFRQGDDRWRCLGIVQRFNNRETVKTRIDVHYRQTDIVQAKAEDLERRSSATSLSEVSPRFLGGFGDNGVQTIVAIRYEQDTPFHQDILTSSYGFAGLSLSIVLQKLLWITGMVTCCSTPIEIEKYHARFRQEMTSL